MKRQARVLRSRVRRVRSARIQDRALPCYPCGALAVPRKHSVADVGVNHLLLRLHLPLRSPPHYHPHPVLAAALLAAILAVVSGPGDGAGAAGEATQTRRPSPRGRCCCTCSGTWPPPAKARDAGGGAGVGEDGGVGGGGDDGEGGADGAGDEGDGVGGDGGWRIRGTKEPRRPLCPEASSSYQEVLDLPFLRALLLPFLRDPFQEAIQPIGNKRLYPRNRVDFPAKSMLREVWSGSNSARSDVLKEDRRIISQSRYLTVVRKRGPSVIHDRHLSAESLSENTFRSHGRHKNETEAIIQTKKTENDASACFSLLM
ncbi:hypothetical protein J437_LFUL004715 [Ladona fulva]|uniref:Uncharacterized protein n=1 Tax=Ladona fulva TaxID=123851 RepID=A0A8K0KV45_LADFU|nr:hypothetical protein J437_LFUL004715 [Ladona fulva]